MKCRFWKKCRLYSKDSVTCNKDGGFYNGIGERPAGCYRDFEEKEKRE